MVTYLKKNLYKAVINRNKPYSITYLDKNGECKNIKKEKDLYKLCTCMMDDTALIENNIISTFTYDIDNACRYAWGFDTKSAIYFVLNHLKELNSTIVQVTYAGKQMYSLKNNVINEKELQNLKMQIEAYKEQVNIQKEIIKIYEEENQEYADLEENESR